MYSNDIYAKAIKNAEIQIMGDDPKMSMVIDRLNVHYELAKEKFGEDNIIGLFLAGSQNYGTAR